MDKRLVLVDSNKFIKGLSECMEIYKELCEESSQCEDIDTAESFYQIVKKVEHIQCIISKHTYGQFINIDYFIEMLNQNGANVDIDFFKEIFTYSAGYHRHRSEKELQKEQMFKSLANSII